jgi:hypothetical protein
VDPDLIFLVERLLIPMAGMATGIILGMGLFRTVRHFIDRRTAGASDDLVAEFNDLRARVEELEQSRTRMLELEDRVDFAERLLARARESGEAPGGI